jgi:auxin response factor
MCIIINRASPSSFIVSVEKLAKASLNGLSVGMRFKMKFEGEDASERR